MTPPVFPLSAAIVRDIHGRVLAASDLGHASRPIPQRALDPGTKVLLPEEGIRVALVVANSPVGVLDIWGNGRTTSLSTARAVSDFARLVAPLVASGETSSAREPS